MATKEKAIVLTKPVLTIIQKIETKYEITNPKDMEIASEYRVTLKSQLKELVTNKELLTKPANELLKEIRSRYKPFESKLESLLDILDSAMSKYQTAETKRVQEEEAKIVARVGEGKGKLQADTAIRKMDEIEKPEVRVATKSGATSFRPHQQLKIVDEKKIPMDYYDLNESRLLTALKSGSIVPGAEIEIIQIPVNR